MRYLRAAIVLVTSLLICPCVLFPAGYMSDSWNNGFMWFADAGRPLAEVGGDYFIIAWQWTAIEIAFFVLGAGVVFMGTYLPRRKATRFVVISLFLSALLGVCVHLPYWLHIPHSRDLQYWLSDLTIDYVALFWVDVSLLIGFLTGLVLLRKQRRPSSRKLGSL